MVPVKPLAGALGRLRAALAEPERRALQEAMLDDVLAACRGCPGLAGALVVTADPAVAARARAAGARVLPDHDPPLGMNPAVARGLACLAEEGAPAALVLTADLPLARPADLSAVMAADPGEAGVTLVPSRDGTGTNALLLRPPGAIATALGPGSLARHAAAAARAGLPVRRLDLPGLALDIDTPEDLELLVAAAGAGVAAAALRERPLAGARR